jgi:hypothetical protein
MGRRNAFTALAIVLVVFVVGVSSGIRPWAVVEYCNVGPIETLCFSKPRWRVLWHAYYTPQMWSLLPGLVLIAYPVALLVWWWVRGLRTGVYVFPYFRVDRRRQRIEFWFWVIVVGVLIAAMSVWFVWGACCAPQPILAQGRSETG